MDYFYYKIEVYSEVLAIDISPDPEIEILLSEPDLNTYLGDTNREVIEIMVHLDYTYQF